MATYQSEAYECARNTSVVSVDESEWINEFSDGIQVRKGDNIRILGSFVHEGNSGEELEVVEDRSLNIQFSPYLDLNTFATNGGTEDNLINLASVSDIASSTDATGIEPPLNFISNADTNPNVANFTYPTGDVNAYSDPVSTGSFTPNPSVGLTGILGDGRTAFYPQADIQQNWGINYNTNVFKWVGAGSTALGRESYNGFRFNSIPQELYISQIVKKFILPVHTGFKKLVDRPLPNPDVYETNRYADLVDNPTPGQAGFMNGVPKPGMYITTVDIAQSSGWLDDEGNGYFENHWGSGAKATYSSPNVGTIAGDSNRIGIANLKSGAQSLIGRIVAVRPMKQNINGYATDCYEIYATDWISPASINNTGWANNATDRVGTMTNASTMVPDKTGTSYFKVPHGAGINEYNYQVNPSFNNINGALNQNLTSTTSSDGGYSGGNNSGVPQLQNYNAITNKKNQVAPSSFKTDPTPAEVGFGQAQGLSFPWNGTYTGCTRFGSFEITTPGTGAGETTGELTARFRGNSNLMWHNFTPGGGSGGSGGVVAATEKFACLSTYEGYMYDTGSIIEFRPIGSERYGMMGAVPACLGAYMIMNKEDVIKLCNGEYVSENDPNYLSGQAGRIPRVYFEWSRQLKESAYKTRHYTNNKWDRDTAGSSSTLDANPANTSLRHGYDLCGMPQNINYRAEVPTQAIVNDADFRSSDLPAAFGPSGSVDANNQGFQPICYSSPNGFRTWATAGTSANRIGNPYEYCGYNNCINSIHFQEKDTGSTVFSFATQIVKTTLEANLVAGTHTITVASAPFVAKFVPAPGDCFMMWNETDLTFFDGIFNKTWVEIATVSVVGANYVFTTYNEPASNPAPNNRRGQWDIKFNKTTDANCFVKVQRGQSIREDRGFGTINPKAWSTDMLMIKESIAKVKIPAGFYTEEQMAETINTQLHLRPDEYAEQLGERIGDTTTFNIPTNVGVMERAFPSEPSIVNGNYLHTYIPDVSYAFSPITAQVASRTNLGESTAELTDTFFTYDCSVATPGTSEFYWDTEQLEKARPYNGTTVRKMSDNQSGYGTVLGSHSRFYTIPYNPIPLNTIKETHLARLTGGALSYADFAITIPPPAGSSWDNQIRRAVGSVDMLRDQLGNVAAYGDTPLNNGIINYRHRLNRNLLSYGGGCKIFCGANNPTFSWEEGKNRFSLNSLYTPVRPHEPNDGSKAEFGIDDAVPSAIINMKPIGKIIGQLCGIYINKLNGDAFTQANFGDPLPGDNWLYDTETQEEISTLGQQFLDILGFTTAQLSDFNNSFNTVSNLFIYKTPKEQSGSAIRVAPKISTAVNGTNPVASNCLNVAPVVQFFVEVDTDDFFAVSVPQKGADPYYFIGSDFPTKKFYGNLTGDKLPVIGICSRNFHSFNFVFDLGGSSISYTMEEDCLITSIRTQIYPSNLGTPKNLSPFSSVIYLITRNNIQLGLPTELQPQEVAIAEANETAPMVGGFYNQAEADYRTAPPVIIPKDYYESEGSYVPSDTESNDSY